MKSRPPIPMDPHAVPAYVGDRERDEVVHRLGDHYALDHLNIEEYEFRVQAALRASQWYELTAITSDLPSLDPNRSSAVRPEAGPSVGGRSLLALGPFFAPWPRYVPSGRPRGAPAAEASAAVAPSR